MNLHDFGVSLVLDPTTVVSVKPALISFLKALFIRMECKENEHFVEGPLFLYFTFTKVSAEMDIPRQIQGGLHQCKHATWHN